MVVAIHHGNGLEVRKGFNILLFGEGLHSVWLDFLEWQSSAAQLNAPFTCILSSQAAASHIVLLYASQATNGVPSASLCLCGPSAVTVYVGGRRRRSHSVHWLTSSTKYRLHRCTYGRCISNLCVCACACVCVCVCVCMCMCVCVRVHVCVCVCVHACMPLMCVWLAWTDASST